VGGRPKDSVEIFKAHHRAWELGAWSAAMDANLGATHSVRSDGTLESRSASGWFAAFKNDIEAGRYFETKISHPTLMFFATDLDQQRVLQFDEGTRTELLSLAIQTDRKRLEQIEVFRSNGPHVRIILMQETAHYCFVQRPQMIIRTMREFFDDSAL